MHNVQIVYVLLVSKNYNESRLKNFEHLAESNKFNLYVGKINTRNVVIFMIFIKIQSESEKENNSENYSYTIFINDT